LIKSETLDLTQDLALEFANMPASLTERDLYQKRLDYLTDTIVGGRAIAFSWARAHVLENDKIYRVNGHHSSTAAAKLNGSLPPGLRVHIDDYEVDTTLSLALLFRQFDSRMSTRKIEEISAVYQRLQTPLVDIPPKAARAAVEGIAWYLGRVVGDYMPTSDDKFNLFAEAKYHPFIQMTGRILSVKTPEFTQAVMGAMYGTYESSPEEAETFWTDVARQGGSNEETHPTKVLDAYLLAAKQEKVQKPPVMAIYRACAVAWNAYRNHRSMDKIGRYDPKKGAPELE